MFVEVSGVQMGVQATLSLRTLSLAGHVRATFSREQMSEAR